MSVLLVVSTPSHGSHGPHRILRPAGALALRDRHVDRSPTGAADGAGAAVRGPLTRPL